MNPLVCRVEFHQTPVPVCKVKYTTLTPGGAGNKQYSTTGVVVEPVGMIGADSSG